MSGEQLELFGRPIRLQMRDAIGIYWPLEWAKLPGRSHRSDRKRIEEHLGDVWLDEMTKFTITGYLADRKLDNPDLRDSTLNKEHARVTRILNFFYEGREACRTGGKIGGYDLSGLQLPPVNPGEMIQKKDEKKYRRNIVLTPEQFFRWCDYAHPETRKIATIAVLTLLRKKDIRLLADSNLDRILDALSGVQSKTQQPYNVPATHTIKIMFGEAKREAREFVCDFTNHRRRWTRACEESGIWFRLMDLRRTGATHLLLEGFDIITVQRLLGHTQIATTMVYLNPPAKAGKEATRTLERKFADRQAAFAAVTVDFSEN